MSICQAMTRKPTHSRTRRFLPTWRTCPARSKGIRLQPNICQPGRHSNRRGRPQKGKTAIATAASLFDITSPFIAPLTTSPDSFCSPVWGSGRKVSDGGAVRAVHEPRECRPVSETGKDEVFEGDFPNRVASPGCHG